MCLTLKRIFWLFPLQLLFLPHHLVFLSFFGGECFSLVIFKGNKDVWQSYSFCIFFSIFTAMLVSGHLQWENMKFIYIILKVISKNGSRFTQLLWTVFPCPWWNPFKVLCVGLSHPTVLKTILIQVQPIP